MCLCVWMYVYVCVCARACTYTCTLVWVCSPVRASGQGPLPDINDTHTCDCDTEMRSAAFRDIMPPKTPTQPPHTLRDALSSYFLHNFSRRAHPPCSPTSGAVNNSTNRPPSPKPPGSKAQDMFSDAETKGEAHTPG